ncbi:formylmethanofuran dehydrogenase subunit E family protein [Salinarimonas soli]|uniref:formylmethanofuran dehydrogenase subunit E family protein n=1 Tax=Salinarimonas soli TaxID=1638099 RepID=UPI00166216A1|nr:formylmethanofuran dehydrogenase subunit E family protein [Salinarimonas soli]
MITALVATLIGTAAHAHDPSFDRIPPQTREELIAAGKRVHGGFGTLVALGIRIGTDAAERLGAGPREVDVTYFDSPAAPCACIVDGITVATAASPGQRTLRIAPEPAGYGLLARVVIRHRRTGRAVEAAVPLEVLPGMSEVNAREEGVRWAYVMHADRDEHFTLTDLPAKP